MLKDVKAGDFKDFNRNGYCKVVGNFYLQPGSKGALTLSTETRILCLGCRAKLAFLFYWMVIRPFSGWTRLVMLRTVKERAEVLK